MADIFSEIRSPKLRIRVPAGGNSGQAITVNIDGNDDSSSTNVIPAKEWSLVDDVLNVADAASFTIANDDGENTGKIVPGQKIIIDESDPDVANGQWTRQFTGRVTTVEDGSDLAGGSIIAVTAMDLGWHLTQCHGKPLTKLQGITIGQMLERLIDPSWGISATVTNGNLLNTRLKQGRTGVARLFVPPKTILPFIQVEPGQSPFEIIRTYVAREGLLINMGANGDMILFRPDYSTDDLKYDSIEYHGSKDDRRTRNNVVGRPTLRLSIDGMYSEVQCWSTVVKPTLVQEAAISNNPNAAYVHETFRPPSNPLPFSRLFVFSDGEAINSTMRRNRAVWKWQMDAFNSWEYTAEVPRHSSGGIFYTSNAMVTVNDSVRGVAATYYIQAVRRSVTMQGGIRTRLTIRKPLIDPTLQAQTGGGARKAAQIPSPRQ